MSDSLLRNESFKRLRNTRSAGWISTDEMAHSGATCALDAQAPAHDLDKNEPIIQYRDPTGAYQMSATSSCLTHWVEAMGMTVTEELNIPSTRFTAHRADADRPCIACQEIIHQSQTFYRAVGGQTGIILDWHEECYTRTRLAPDDGESQHYRQRRRNRWHCTPPEESADALEVARGQIGVNLKALTVKVRSDQVASESQDAERGVEA